MSDLQEQAQTELAWAQHYETIAQSVSDPKSKSEWLEQARQARELAARLAEEAAQP